MNQNTPKTEEIFAILRGVIDPELGSNIVELGMVKDVQIETSGSIELTVALTTKGCPLRSHIQKECKAKVRSLPGVTDVSIQWTELTSEEKAVTMATARKNAAQESQSVSIPPTTKVLAIASGKGGVGKSSVTTNLAVALARQGFNIGVIDADIWGFSLPRLFGVSSRMQAQKVDGKERPQITPHTIDQFQGRIDLVSMGMLVEDETSALLWRGLILNRAVQHFLEDVAWGKDTDYLLIDLPPGTGDIAMGLAQMLPRTEVLVVTTPAVAAQKVAARAISMAQKCHLRVAGIIENMSYFMDPSGEKHNIFGSGGGTSLAETSNIPLLGTIPIDPKLAQGGDKGTPIAGNETLTAKVFHKLAEQISTEISPPVEMSSCTARMLQRVEEALDQNI